MPIVNIKETYNSCISIRKKIDFKTKCTSIDTEKTFCNDKMTDRSGRSFRATILNLHASKSRASKWMQQNRQN